jgi:hypothetical protein
MTPLQVETLLYITLYTSLFKHEPTLREIAAGMAFNDHSQARRIRDCLRGHGIHFGGAEFLTPDLVGA